MVTTGVSTADGDDDDVPLLRVPQINAVATGEVVADSVVAAHQDALLEGIGMHDDDGDQHHGHHLHYVPLYTKPTARQAWVSHTSDHTGEEVHTSSLASSKEHRIATDSDLVLDLVYVIILAHLGRVFRDRALELNDPAWAFRDFFSLFATVWFQWYAAMTHLNVFEQADVVHLIFFLLNLITTAYIGRSVGPCGAHVSADCKTFVRSISVGRGLIVAMQAHAWYFSPKVRRGIFVTMFPNILVTILYAVVGELETPLPASHLDILWAIALLVDNIKLLSPVYLKCCSIIKHKHQEALQNLALHVERQHLFVILSIGELITAGLAGGAAEHAAAAANHSRSNGSSPGLQRGHEHVGPPNASYFDAGGGEHPNPLHGTGLEGDESFWLVGLVVVLAGLMKVAIFDVQDHPEPHGTCSTTGQTHALARQSVWGRWCAVLWIGCYPFLNVCIVLTAAMLEPLTLHGDLTTLAQTTISLTMASILFITASQDLLHYGGPRSTSRRISKPGRVLGRYAFAAAVGCMALLKWEDRKPLFLVTVNLLMLGAVSFTLFARHPAKSKKVH